MTAESPKVVVLSGPNGAGKSTAAAKLLLGAHKVEEFVNADTIALGLSAFAQERVAFEAGRIMLQRIDELANHRASFAFETTLASRSYVPRLRLLREAGYQVRLVFLWLRSVDEAITRVAYRVRAGGHDIPEEVIRRRYFSGIKNLFELYLPLCDSWQLVDNSLVDAPRLIAVGGQTGSSHILDPLTWDTMRATIRT